MASEIRVNTINNSSGLGTITISDTGQEFSGITTFGTVTATSYSGDGSSLTGVASTDNIRTNTNATFLQNVNITGAGLTVGRSFMRDSSIGIGTTTTAGRNAGVGTAFGTLIYDATTDKLEVYGAAGWVTVKSAGKIEATGGTKDTSSRPGYAVHTFTGDGTFTITSGQGQVEYLIVAGGGGGGVLRDVQPRDGRGRPAH